MKWSDKAQKRRDQLKAEGKLPGGKKLLESYAATQAKIDDLLKESNGNG